MSVTCVLWLQHTLVDSVATLSMYVTMRSLAATCAGDHSCSNTRIVSSIGVVKKSGWFS
jgi:hypothetical protein